MISGILLSLLFWWRLAKHDSRLLLIYFGALGGAFFGAKIVYLAAEGWMHWQAPNRWLHWATGKTITGALLGGYAGVEIAKAWLGYHRATGDWFAIITPAAIGLGRIGCWLHGCCRGVRCEPHWFTIQDAEGLTRWPSVQAELAFNLFALCSIVWLRKQRLLPNQHFHIYLIGYGLFRFCHEFLRDDPRIFGPLSGYHLAALAVLGLGIFGFVRRLSQPSTFHHPPGKPAIAAS